MVDGNTTQVDGPQIGMVTPIAAAPATALFTGLGESLGKATIGRGFRYGKGFLKIKPLSDGREGLPRLASDGVSERGMPLGIPGEQSLESWQYHDGLVPIREARGGPRLQRATTLFPSACAFPRARVGLPLLSHLPADCIAAELLPRS